MELSHLLVPLNYVRDSIFDHDLALKAAPIPALAEIDQLARTESGTNSYYQLKTVLGRRLNQINFALLQANRVAANLNRLVKSP
jgi:hypothetical protein